MGSVVYPGLTPWATFFCRSAAGRRFRVICRFIVIGLTFGILAPGLLAAEKAATKGIPIATIDHPTPVDFEREILPIFRTSCLACHNRTTTKGGLILETPQTILKGGEDGPVVVPGKSAESPLLELSAHQS